MGIGLQIVLLGAGGHAKVLLDTLCLLGRNIKGVTSLERAAPSTILGVPVLGTDDVLSTIDPSQVLLVNAVGSTAPRSVREGLFRKFKDRGFSFESVIHPSAVVAGSVTLGEGVQIMAGAILQPDCRIGENVIINTGASVDHDGTIGAHVHVAPGATICGGVSIGEGTHLGSGCTVIQGIRVGARALVAAGATVVRDVSEGARVRGTPATPF